LLGLTKRLGHSLNSSEAIFSKDWLLSVYDENKDGVVSYDGNELPKPPPASAIEQIHLAFGKRDNEMVVTWQTPTPPSGQVFVEYGESKDSLLLKQIGTIQVLKDYNEILAILFGAGKYRAYISSVTLTNLDDLSSSQVFYRCSNGTHFSRVFNFTNPSITRNSNEVRLAVFGDQGTYIPIGFLTSQMLSQLVSRNAIDFVQIVGDLAYATVSGSGEGSFQQIWDWYLRQSQSYASTVPMQVTVGNHEHPRNFSSFKKRFTMPGNNNMWYSFDVGPLHILSFSTESSWGMPYTPGSPQYAFIEQDLKAAAANRANVPWILVVGHRPFYCSDTDEYSSHNGDPSTSTLSRYLEPLFHQYGVQLVISGHMHCYTRSLPVYNRTTTFTNRKENIFRNIEGTPIYATVGSGGVFLDYSFVDPQPSWSAIRSPTWGISRLTVNATRLHFEFLKTRQEQFEVFDEFTIFTS